MIAGEVWNTGKRRGAGAHTSRHKERSDNRTGQSTAGPELQSNCTPERRWRAVSHRGNEATRQAEPPEGSAASAGKTMSAKGVPHVVALGVATPVLSVESFSTG